MDEAHEEFNEIAHRVFGNKSQLSFNSNRIQEIDHSSNLIWKLTSKMGPAALTGYYTP
jgi:hypothetical protein